MALDVLTQKSGAFDIQNSIQSFKESNDSLDKNRDIIDEANHVDGTVASGETFIFLVASLHITSWSESQSVWFVQVDYCKQFTQLGV